MGLVYVALTRVPQVLAYDLSGTLVWFAVLKPFHPALIRDTDEFGVINGIDEDVGRMNELKSFTLVANETLVVQHSEYTLDERFRRGQAGLYPSGLDTWIVDVDSKTGWFMGSMIPEVVASGGGLLVLSRDAPFPSVSFTQLDVGGPE